MVLQHERIGYVHRIMELEAANQELRDTIKTLREFIKSPDAGKVDASEEITQMHQNGKWHQID